MKSHDWSFQRLEYVGQATHFHWSCDGCGAHVTTETEYRAPEHRAYLHMPEWKPRIGWEPDCDVEAARLIHES